MIQFWNKKKITRCVSRESLPQREFSLDTFSQFNFAFISNLCIWIMLTMEKIIQIYGKDFYISRTSIICFTSSLWKSLIFIRSSWLLVKRSKNVLILYFLSQLYTLGGNSNWSIKIYFNAISFFVFFGLANLPWKLKSGKFALGLLFSKWKVSSSAFKKGINKSIKFREASWSPSLISS